MIDTKIDTCCYGNKVKNIKREENYSDSVKLTFKTFFFVIRERHATLLYSLTPNCSKRHSNGHFF